MVAAAPQLPAALEAKKAFGNVIVTLLAALQALETGVTGSAVAVVKAKVTDCAVFAATRLANKGMFMETAVTRPCIVPTVPVAEQVVV